jgi:hypothetical protein
MVAPDAAWNQLPFNRSQESGPAKPMVIHLEDDGEGGNVIDFPNRQQDGKGPSLITQHEDGSMTVDLDGPRLEHQKTDDFDANLSESMDDLDLGRIAEDLMEGIDADLRSREEWVANRDRAIDLLGLKIEPPRSGPGGGGAPLQGMSTAKDPSLLDAVIRGQANAIGEFLPAEGPVKIDDLGDVANDELAEMLQKDFNYWLTNVATEYYPDTKQMFAWMYFGGAAFKKVCHDPIKRRPASLAVDAKDLVVSNAATDLMNADRVTHIVEYRKSDFRRMIVEGFYRDDVASPAPTPQDKDRLSQKIESIEGVRRDDTRPEDMPYTVYECRCELEIDWDRFMPKKFKGRGVPLPYSVSIEKDSRRILSIYRDWKKEDEDARRKRTFVRFCYIDWLGFYGIGLLHVMGNLTMALTAMLRISIDNGMFSNFPGGVSAKSTAGKQSENEKIAGPGQFLQVDLNGLDDIRKVVMAMPYQDIKQGFLAIMDKVREVCQKVGGTADMPVGEGRADIPVGTILALIEQATKVESAVHKGMHSSTAIELELLVDLFREDPEALYRHLTKARRRGLQSTWNEQLVLQALNDYDLVPKSDPNTPSHLHRIMKVVALLQLLAQDPGGWNKEEIYREALRVLGIKQPEKFLAPPQTGPAPPNPQEITANAKMIAAQTDANTKPALAQAKLADTAMKKQQMQSDENVANTGLAKELVIHGSNQRDQQFDRSNKQAKMGLDVQKHGLDLKKHALDATVAAHDANMDVAEFNKPEPTAAPA